MPFRVNFKKSSSIAILTILALMVYSYFGATQIFAASCEWIGTTSFEWEISTNWTNCGGGVPGAADSVLIDLNHTVNINATTTIDSLTLGNIGGTTTPTLNFAYDAIGGSALIIDDGNLVVYSGATITHSNATSGDTLVGTVSISVGGTTNINSGGAIQLNGKGYIGGTNVLIDGEGSGGGIAAAGGSGQGGGGGGYGGSGEGGATGGPAGGTPYGNHDNPIHLGSGGGGGYWGGVGGSGGGAIFLVSSGTITIDGDITANGGNGSGGGWSGGGGSGGSINIQGPTLTGSGTISTNGGAANVPTPPAEEEGEEEEDGFILAIPPRIHSQDQSQVLGTQMVLL